MIGASAATLLLINGDIMGLSGIFSSAFLHPIRTAQQQPWKLVFVACFLTTAALHAKLAPNCISQPGSLVPSTLAYAVSGFLVGFGTKLGNGCTSGHGICGLARFSKRSFAAVGTFMATGILTTLLIPESLFRTKDALEVSPRNGMYMAAMVSSLLAALRLLVPHAKEEATTTSTSSSNAPPPPSPPRVKSLGAILSAGLAAVGLGISGMVQSAKISNFLNLSLLLRSTSSFSLYDPTLMTVMGAGVICSWIGYQFLPNYTLVCPKNKCMTKPLMDDKFHVPTSTHMDWQLVGGAAIFGVGWGMGTLCPGPAFFHVAAGTNNVLVFWFPTYLAGAFSAERLVHYIHQSHHSSKRM
jgi:uncharacterized protein